VLDALTKQNVHFEIGGRHTLGHILDDMGLSRAMVLTTPEQCDAAHEIASIIGDHAAGIYSRAAMHTPVDVTRDAVAHAREIKADCVIAIGGGSTIGLGKAITLNTALPQIAVPTTYAGSEATPILGQTENGIKTTLTDAKVRPATVLYDAELVTSLPIAMSVTSGLNAIAHAAEGLYAKEATEATRDLALDGIRCFADGLPKVAQGPKNVQAREDTLRGAWACGAVLGTVGMALHHKLCHALGGSFNLPHAETHAIILPHAIAFNEVVAKAELAPVAQIFSDTQAGHALWTFAKILGAPMRLADLGLLETDLERAVQIATEKPYWNPRDITKDAILRILKQAWAGEPPELT